MRWSLFVLLAAMSALGCGYQLVHAGSDPLGPFVVVGGSAHAPDAALAAAAEEGARAELARAGQLGSRGAPGEIEIDLLRVDERGQSISLGPGGVPGAGGVQVMATGRGRLRRAGSTTPERDTGDVRVSDTAARSTTVAAGGVTRDEAGRMAARRLGETLVRRLLGVPQPGEP